MTNIVVSTCSQITNFLKLGNGCFFDTSDRRRTELNLGPWVCIWASISPHCFFLSLFGLYVN
ncbi:hypothetical protein ACE6H2_026939 [Prunus campanulata]